MPEVRIESDKAEADNAAGEHIRDESGVHKAFPGSHIGNITQPTTDSACAR